MKKKKEERKEGEDDARGRWKKKGKRDANRREGCRDIKIHGGILSNFRSCHAWHYAGGALIRSNAMEILCVHLCVVPVHERVLHSRTRECIHGG